MNIKRAENCAYSLVTPCKQNLILEIVHKKDNNLFVNMNRQSYIHLNF